MTIRIAIADDHQVFCQGLAAMVEAADIQVVSVTGDRDQLFEIILQERPDVAIVDVSMPGVSIVELLSMLRQQQIPTQLLVLTGNTQPHLAEEMLQAGARGYVLKEHAFEDILSAIRSVAAGRSFVSPQLAGTLLQRKDGPVSDHHWTDRQLEILRLVAAGETSKRIAGKMGIHSKTVDDHRNRIREKLGARSAAEMVRIASQRGLI